MTTHNNKNSVYFPDELWSLIKSYGGIYDMKTPISKMPKDIINDVYVEVEKINENRGFPYNKIDVFTKKKQLQRIYKYIWNYKIASYIQNVCQENKANNFKCGDEVYVGNKKYTAGIITKINEYTIQVKPFVLEKKIYTYPFSNEDKSKYYGMCDPTYMEWKVQYYDKTKLGRAFTIHSQYVYKNNNNNKIEWNDKFDYCFVCKKFIGTIR